VHSSEANRALPKALQHEAAIDLAALEGRV
jgi:hypothetical protein